MNLDREGFSPAEFAALFGKSTTWGYRQLYSGKVKATTEYGRLLIPRAEVERLAKSADVYDGVRVPKAASPRKSPAKAHPEVGPAAPQVPTTSVAKLRRTSVQLRHAAPVDARAEAIARLARPPSGRASG